MSDDETGSPWLTPQFVADELARFFRRSELIKLAGGIALKDVVDGTATVPPGWVMDVETFFFVPAGFDPSTSAH